MDNFFRSPLCLCALAGLLVSASLTARADVATDLTRAEVGLMKALAGEAGADPAVAAYAALVPDETAAPLVLACLGAAQSLQGRDAWLPWNKMKATERGLASVDKALRQLAPHHEEARLRGNPVAVETRLVAATTFLSVPDRFFHRADQGRSLLHAAVARPDFDALPPTLRARHHQQLAVAAGLEKNPAEVAAQRQKCLAADPHGPVAAACRRLKEPGA